MWYRYATKVDDPTVWSTLGHHQLSKRMVNDCIGSYLLAKVRFTNFTQLL